MPLELRSRITLLLPAPMTLPQHFLVEGILTSLIDVCGGITVSSDLPPAFRGSWIKRDGRLKLRSQQAFNQDLVWVTVHEVQRITAYDPAP